MWQRGGGTLVRSIECCCCPSHHHCSRFWSALASQLVVFLIFLSIKSPTLSVMLTTANVSTTVTCFNGGTAIPDRPYCQCLPQFDGDYCQRQSPCIHGSIGVSSGKLRCICYRHWTGVNCTLPICVHGHRSVDGGCICQPNYTGFICDKPIDCGLHGHIDIKLACKCDDGWIGDRCQHVDCGPNGWWWSDGDAELCRCMPRFEGDRCERCVRPYSGDNCDHREHTMVPQLSTIQWALVGMAIPLTAGAVLLVIVYLCAMRNGLVVCPTRHRMDIYGGGGCCRECNGTADGAVVVVHRTVITDRSTRAALIGIEPSPMGGYHNSCHGNAGLGQFPIDDEDDSGDSQHGTNLGVL